MGWTKQQSRRKKINYPLYYLANSDDANWCKIICQIKIPKWCSTLALNTNQSQEWFNCFIWNRLGKACSWLWLDPKSAFLSLKSVPRPQLGVSEKSKSKSEDICLGNNWGRINLFLQERISNLSLLPMNFCLWNKKDLIKKSAGCLLKTLWLIKDCIFRATQILLSNCSVQFFHQPLCCQKVASWNFLLQKKNRQMKAGQNNIYDITKTLDLVEQECDIIYW